MIIVALVPLYDPRVGEATKFSLPPTSTAVFTPPAKTPVAVPAPATVTSAVNPAPPKNN